MADIICDLHTHTIVSGHAYGTIREMAYEAGRTGIKLLGFSEHAPGIPGTIDPFYYLNLHVIPRTLYDVEILHGCEINVLNGGRLSLEQRFIDHLDYAIVGIHRHCYRDEGRQKNTENVIACMQHEKVHFVSHPDDDHTPLDYEMLVKAAKRHRVALEVNNSSLVKVEQRLNCVQNYKTMLALCMEHKVNILVSSDAHDPSGVGKVDVALGLLEELDFDEDLIVNNSVEKVKELIR